MAWSLVPSDARLRTVHFQPGDRIRVDRTFLVKQRKRQDDLPADLRAQLMRVSNQNPTAFKLDAFSNSLSVVQATGGLRVNGILIGADHRLKIGDRVDFVEGSSALAFVVSSDIAAPASGKRAVDEAEAGDPPPAKRTAVVARQPSPPSGAVASAPLTTTLRGARLPAGWRAHADSLLVWRTPAPYAPRACARIAGFDFDGTLATFHRDDLTRWEMTYPRKSARRTREDDGTPFRPRDIDIRCVP